MDGRPLLDREGMTGGHEDECHHLVACRMGSQGLLEQYARTGCIDRHRFPPGQATSAEQKSKEQPAKDEYARGHKARKNGLFLFVNIGFPGLLTKNHPLIVLHATLVSSPLRV